MYFFIPVQHTAVPATRSTQVSLRFGKQAFGKPGDCAETGKAAADMKHSAGQYRETSGSQIRERQVFEKPAHWAACCPELMLMSRLFPRNGDDGIGAVSVTIAASAAIPISPISPHRLQI